ncbi:hypothetical protein fugu_017850 [Takifugu bimaculatus]|uniref:RING-type domain-containing protein n=1 Tax=Takifugu bimaculatus TaxID=433685 RepID=A0A4Z2BS47_9TELE|nr:hypothetical protein fugu_017850 [Takifugu bimaculatus]
MKPSAPPHKYNQRHQKIKGALLHATYYSICALYHCCHSCLLLKYNAGQPQRHHGAKMAQNGMEDPFSCYICFHLLEEPVTIPCGHTYCRRCITHLWDRQPVPSCPQCLQSFSPCPVLMKNTILGVLVEQLQRRGRLDPVDCSAGAEDVACDSCIGEKMKAIRSCLVCLVSYCRWHLQPHFQSPAFQKHTLVEPRETLQQNFCPQHNEVMKMFCRTDQQLICNICYMDAHKDHDTASTLMERTERQKALIEIQKEVQQRIQEKEKDFQALKEEVEVVDHSANKAVEDIDRFFHEMFQHLERKHSEKRDQIEAMREVEMSHGSKLKEKLQQEIEELTRANDQLKELFLTQDHTQFLHSSFSLLRLAEPADSPVTQVRHLKHFENATGRLVPRPAEDTEPGGELARRLRHGRPDGGRGSDVAAAPETSRLPEIFLQPHSGSQDGAPDDSGGLSVALSYRSIHRRLYFNESGFGFNLNSWALHCDKGNYVFYHDKVPTPIVGDGASRIGVYLDHSAGILAFYNISHTMTLLHRVQTAFAQPLHAGIRFHGDAGDEAEFLTLKKIR